MGQVEEAAERIRQRPRQLIGAHISVNARRRRFSDDPSGGHT